MNNTNTAKVHAFEKAGLGVAPFRFIGIERRVGPVRIDGNTTVGAPGQPMGTCQYCYQGIAECCVIQDANGKRFVVGNVCVRKTDDRGLIDTVKRAVNTARREAKHQREIARIKRAKETLQDARVAAVFRAERHPNAYYAEKQGRTMFDYLEWMLHNAGNAGGIKAARQIEAAAKATGAAA